MKFRLQTMLLSAVLTLGGFAAVTITSCSEDKCKTIRCANYGVCQDGACVCPTGYEGTLCGTLNRERFEGTWSVSEHGTYSSAAQYAISIENGQNLTDILIKNFRNSLTQNVSAYVKGDTLYIPQQTINGKTIQGIGLISNYGTYGDHGTLEVKYSVKDGINPDDEFGLDAGTSSQWTK